MEYVAERNRKNIAKINELLNDLPDFCAEFFIGVENRTTPLTRLNYCYDLRLFFEYICNLPKFSKNILDFSLSDLSKVTSTDIERFLSYTSLYERNGKQTVNESTGKFRKLSTIRSLFKYFYNKDKLPENVSSKILMPKIKEKEIIRLDSKEIIKVLDEAEYGDNLSPRQQAFHEHQKSRDVAILTLFLGTGIRISECVGLNIDDINFDDNSFKVTRKGGNRVILFFSDEVAGALKWYLETRLADKDVDEKESALFLSSHKKRINVRTVQNLVKKYAKIASPLKHITPHKLRSTFGTRLYEETGDIYAVAEVLGHKDINTTKKHYAATSEKIRRDAINKVKLHENT